MTDDLPNTLQYIRPTPPLLFRFCPDDLCRSSLIFFGLTVFSIVSSESVRFWIYTRDVYLFPSILLQPGSLFTHWACLLYVILS